MPYRIPQTMVAALVALAGSSTALAQTVQADLHGYQEVPVVSTAATGSLKAKIDADAGMIHWELTYEGLQGTVAQAHIHLGQTSVNGGIAGGCARPLRSRRRPARRFARARAAR